MQSEGLSAPVELAQKLSHPAQESTDGLPLQHELCSAAGLALIRLMPRSG